LFRYGNENENICRSECRRFDDKAYFAENDAETHFGFECQSCPENPGGTVAVIVFAVLLLGCIIYVAVKMAAKLKQRMLLFLLLIASQLFQLSFITLQINGLFSRHFFFFWHLPASLYHPFRACLLSALHLSAVAEFPA